MCIDDMRKFGLDFECGIVCGIEIRNLIVFCVNFPQHQHRTKSTIRESPLTHSQFFVMSNLNSPSTSGGALDNTGGNSGGGNNEKLRLAYVASLEEKWEKAKTLLVTVNDQNKTLRDELSRKTEQLKKLYDECQHQKSSVAELEQEREALNARLRDQLATIQKLEQMVEQLTDASSGLHGEQELRLADLQRSNERLVHEVAQRDDECRELRAQVDAMRAKTLDLRAQLELKESQIAKLTQEKSFLRYMCRPLNVGSPVNKLVCRFCSSQLSSERSRCNQLVQEIDGLRARIVDAESRTLLNIQSSGLMSHFPRWLQQLIADRTTSLYVGVFGVVSLLLMWFYVTTR